MIKIPLREEHSRVLDYSIKPKVQATYIPPLKHIHGKKTPMSDIWERKRGKKPLQNKKDLRYSFLLAKGYIKSLNNYAQKM